ncbi:MAG: hypothetical protein CSA70_01740 [Rhodobacterales bacterium]|nr:MAG: hypothetical protein CSA70_01740 [Rhodobacterales bacterium]
MSVPLARYPGVVTFTFGDSAGVSARVLSLGLTGQKTLTCDVVAGFAARGEALPEARVVDQGEFGQ